MTLKSFFDWAAKELEAAEKLAGDLIKMLASPGSYPIRLALYELAMLVWDIVQKTHEILAHLGFVVPHGELRYPDGELMLGNEIDESLITLGSTVDGTFLQALGDAVDPFGNLDRTVPPATHEIGGSSYPYYQTALYDSANQKPQAGKLPPYSVDTRDYKRPWAYPELTPLLNPDNSESKPPVYGTNHTEQQVYQLRDEDHWSPQPAPPIIPGPFPRGSKPDVVFFRTDTSADAQARKGYEESGSPMETDRLNTAHITPQTQSSPLGDPIPFTAYLIGRVLNDRGYSAQFNLDSDRAFGYLTWDWAREQDPTQNEDLGFAFRAPQVWPQTAPEWLAHPSEPMRLLYVDKPHVAQVPQSANATGSRQRTVAKRIREANDMASEGDRDKRRMPHVHLEGGELEVTVRYKPAREERDEDERESEKRAKNTNPSTAAAKKRNPSTAAAKHRAGQAKRSARAGEVLTGRP